MFVFISVQTIYIAKVISTVYKSIRKSLSKEEGKNQESIQWSTTPDPGHHMGK